MISILSSWETFKPVWVKALRYNKKYTISTVYRLRWRDMYTPEGVAFDLLVKFGYPDARWEITPETYEDELDDEYIACIGKRKEIYNLMSLPIPKWLRKTMNQKVCDHCGSITKTKAWFTDSAHDHISRFESFKEAAEYIEQNL